MTVELPTCPEHRAPLFCNDEGKAFCKPRRGRGGYSGHYVDLPASAVALLPMLGEEPAAPAPSAPPPAAATRMASKPPVIAPRPARRALRAAPEEPKALAKVPDELIREASVTLSTFVAPVSGLTVVCDAIVAAMVSHITKATLEGVRQEILGAIAGEAVEPL